MTCFPVFTVVLAPFVLTRIIFISGNVFSEVIPDIQELTVFYELLLLNINFFKFSDGTLRCLASFLVHLFF